MESRDTCQIALVLELIGGKWKGPIIWWVKDGPKRFNELKRLMPEITPRTLTKQLREMVKDGLVERNQFEEIPPRVEYSATKLCLSLVPLLDSLSAWGRSHQKTIEEARERHRDSVPSAGDSC